jgi:hypothetical protein
MLPLSQAAMAEVSISGWINEGVSYLDDGENSALYQTSENGHTLGSRITFAGSSEVSTGLTAGFELIIEPQSSSELLGSGSFGAFGGPGVFGKESIGGPDRFLTSVGAGGNGHGLEILGNSLFVSGAWGKVTAGLVSMPTDNIAVLEDPSLTLWSAISPVFVGNGTTILGTGGVSTGAAWGSFLTCGSGIGGIGIDCNGIYRKGVRYDLPAFGPVTIAVSASNNDVYDVAAKYKGDLGSMKASIALGYAILNHANAFGGNDIENFQLQAGLIHPATGLFGSIAYQHEEMDTVALGLEDETDAWWLKVGIKKQWFSLGDTSFSFNYGQYNDQYVDTTLTGSEVERIGLELNQYFGSSLIIYGVWESLDLDVDTTAATTAAYGGAQDLDSFRLGATYFF